MFIFGKDNISDFIKNHNIATIATVDEQGSPSTSTIFYTISKNDEIWFLTKADTTKYINLQKNNSMALTILDSPNPVAVNMTGIAVEETDVSKKDEIIQTITKISSELLNDYAPIIKLHKGAFRAMRFKPLHAKMTDYTKPMGQAGETLKNY